LLEHADDSGSVVPQLRSGRVALRFTHVRTDDLTVSIVLHERTGVRSRRHRTRPSGSHGRSHRPHSVTGRQIECRLDGVHAARWRPYSRPCRCATLSIAIRPIRTRVPRGDRRILWVDLSGMSACRIAAQSALSVRRRGLSSSQELLPCAGSKSRFRHHPPGRQSVWAGFREAQQCGPWRLP